MLKDTWKKKKKKAFSAHLAEKDFAQLSGIEEHQEEMSEWKGVNKT